MDDVPESATPRRRSRRRSRRSLHQRSHGRLRLLYFGMAAVWGYLIGLGVLMGALRATGAPIEIGGGVAAAVVAGVVVACLGGTVSAAAYRQSRRRLD